MSYFHCSMIFFINRVRNLYANVTVIIGHKSYSLRPIQVTTIGKCIFLILTLFCTQPVTEELCKCMLKYHFIMSNTNESLHFSIYLYINSCVFMYFGLLSLFIGIYISWFILCHIYPSRIRAVILRVADIME